MRVSKVVGNFSNPVLIGDPELANISKEGSTGPINS